ncbi:MAG: hypothetical protein A2Y53_05695 [Chloroflexi bacterium RBG_16_47_49]|nr:MAG: hypothetical protein A2Y53_05695 [Chloroflexi bacterium RBG_16_47_49]
MKVKMAKTIQGSRDGINVETFIEGKTYSFTDEKELDLGNVFCTNGFGAEVREVREFEEKIITRSIENGQRNSKKRF